MNISRMVLMLCALNLAVSVFSSCGIDEGIASGSESKADEANYMKLSMESNLSDLKTSVRISEELKSLVGDSADSFVPYGPYTVIEEYVAENNTDILKNETVYYNKTNGTEIIIDNKNIELVKKIEALTGLSYHAFSAPRVEAELSGAELKPRITLEEVKTFIDESNLSGKDLEDAILNLICERNQYPDTDRGSGIYWFEYFLDEDGKYYVSSVAGQSIYGYYIESEGAYGYATLSEIGSLGENGL